MRRESRQEIRRELNSVLNLKYATAVRDTSEHWIDNACLYQLHTRLPVRFHSDFSNARPDRTDQTIC